MSSKCDLDFWVRDLGLAHDTLSYCAIHLCQVIWRSIQGLQRYRPDTKNAIMSKCDLDLWAGVIWKYIQGLHDTKNAGWQVIINFWVYLERHMRGRYVHVGVRDRLSGVGFGIEWWFIEILYITCSIYMVYNVNISCWVSLFCELLLIFRLLRLCFFIDRTCFLG